MWFPNHELFRRKRILLAFPAYSSSKCSLIGLYIVALSYIQTQRMSSQVGLAGVLTYLT